MDTAIALQEFLEFVVVKLIDQPEQASVLHDLDGDQHVFRVVLAQPDVGKVIGKRGETVAALRSLMDAACSKHRVRATLEVGTREEFGLAPVGE